MQMELLELLKTRSRVRLTVIATMHDLTLAGQFADRLVLINRGGVVTTDRPASRSHAELAMYGMTFGSLTSRRDGGGTSFRSQRRFAEPARGNSNGARIQVS